MGIDPIQYRPWDGKRSSQNMRVVSIANRIFRQKLKSKWILALLILGSILVHVFSILLYPMAPHEGLEAETLVGEEYEDLYPEDPEVTYLAMGPAVDGNVTINGSFEMSGTISLEGGFELYGNISGSGTLNTMGREMVLSGLIPNTLVLVEGILVLNGSLYVSGDLRGAGAMEGESVWMTGSGALMAPPTMPEDGHNGPIITARTGGYLANGLLVIFALLLVALICSDLIAEDLGSNSFVLYFSRPIRTLDYLGGKIAGAAMVMGLFTFLPVMIFCLAMIGTQSGSDWGGSFKVMGQTFVAALLTTLIFIPYGMLISSMTKKRSYAAIGTFMSFFIILIVSQIFINFNVNWALLDPTNVLFFTYYAIFGFAIPPEINGALLGAALVGYLVAPLAFVYLRLYLKGVGR